MHGRSSLQTSRGPWFICGNLVKRGAMDSSSRGRRHGEAAEARRVGRSGRRPPGLRQMVSILLLLHLLAISHPQWTTNSALLYGRARRADTHTTGGKSTHIFYSSTGPFTLGAKHLSQHSHELCLRYCCVRLVYVNLSLSCASVNDP